MIKNAYIHINIHDTLIVTIIRSVVVPFDYVKSYADYKQFVSSSIFKINIWILNNLFSFNNKSNPYYALHLKIDMKLEERNSKNAINELCVHRSFSIHMNILLHDLKSFFFDNHSYFHYFDPRFLPI